MPAAAHCSAQWPMRPICALLRRATTTEPARAPARCRAAWPAWPWPGRSRGRRRTPARRRCRRRAAASGWAPAGRPAACGHSPAACRRRGCRGRRGWPPPDARPRRAPRPRCCPWRGRPGGPDRSACEACRFGMWRRPDCGSVIRGRTSLLPERPTRREGRRRSVRQAARPPVGAIGGIGTGRGSRAAAGRAPARRRAGPEWTGSG